MKTDKAWKIWGDTEPYYAVLTDPKYLGRNLTDEQLENFFVQGEEHVAATFETIRQHIDSSFSPSRALDFGCGTGRVLIPLAARCQSVVGVDVSQGMLREAAANCEARAPSDNWRLLSTAQFLTESDVRYDLLHSHLVFQHIRRREGERLLRLLLTRLEPGGAFALQFMYRSTAFPLRQALTWLKNRLPFGHRIARFLTGKDHLAAPMEMNVYGLGRLMEILTSGGAPALYLQTSRQHLLHQVIIYGKKLRSDCSRNS